MTAFNHARVFGLMAISSAFAASTAFAQSTSPTEEDAAETSTMQTAETSRKTWEDIDTNKDGSIDKAEAAAVPSLERVFEQADANADGALTGDEYKRYLAVNGKRQDGSKTPGGG